MVILSYLVQILILLIIARYTIKILERIKKRGELFEKRENLNFEKELYHEVKEEITEDNIEHVKESRESVEKFKNI